MILEEDVYETCFGDGRFLYAREAFLDGSTAKRRLAERTAENERKASEGNVGYRYSLKTVEIERDEYRNLLVADWKLDPDERCSLGEVVRLLTTGATPP